MNFIKVINSVIREYYIMYDLLITSLNISLNLLKNVLLYLPYINCTRIGTV